MEFDLVDDIKSFCGTYAFTKGFGWKIRNSKRGLDGQLHYMVVLAYTQKESCMSKVPPTLKTIPTSVAKCDAKIITSKRENGVQCLKKVILEYYHDLTPIKVRMFNMNKSTSLHVKKTIQVNDNVGVRSNKIFQSFAQAAGRYENLSFVE